MLLTFIGQISVASDFSSCQMNMQSQNDQNNMQEMDHLSQMMNSQVSSSDLASNMDCCQNDSECSMNGCLSLAPFYVFEAATPVLSAVLIIPSFDTSIIQISNSLYRPPILS